MIEQIFHGRHPAPLRRRIVWMEQRGHIPKVLPRVMEIDDLRGAVGCERLVDLGLYARS
jgi:hypothetical protein